MIPFLLPFLMAAPAVVTVADDADAAAYFAVLSTAPSNAERARVNAVVKGLKDAGAWALMDWVLLLAAETPQAARVNLRKPSKLLTPTNGPTFTPNLGWTGDAVSAYLDLGETFQASGNLFSQNSNCLGAAVSATSAFQGIRPLFGNFANNPRTAIQASNNVNGSNYRAADSTDSYFTTPGGTRNGHYSFSRSSSATKRGFFNGVKSADVALASTGLNATSGTLLHSQSPYSDDTVAFAYTGGGLTDAQMSAVQTVIINYLTPKGISL